MTQARETQVSLDETAFYHCYVRCVRQAFLCGEDRVTGESFEHRKQWIVSRLKFLSYVYAIDICAYAVLSNHYHVVLHVDQARAHGWSDDEVVERWEQLYRLPPLILRWQKARDTLGKAEMTVVRDTVELWRERLYDISWFMRGVNETIARMANEEEGVKGRFWEGRFKSQALLDEAALLSCMAYVDLNPVRAAMAEDLVDSDFTSIQQRIHAYAQDSQSKRNPRVDSAARKRVRGRIKYQETLKQDLNLAQLPEAPLMSFDGSSHTDLDVALPFTREDYLDLVDMTGRVIRDDKKGYIPTDLPPLVKQLGIKPSEWLDHVQNFSRRYGACAGHVARMQDYAKAHDKRWCKGVGVSRRLVA